MNQICWCQFEKLQNWKRHLTNLKNNQNTKQNNNKMWIHMYCKFNILPEYLPVLLSITCKIYIMHIFFYVCGTHTIIMIFMSFIPYVFIYFQELAQMYKTTERSIEDSANLVGLKLPTIDHWKYKSEATIDNVSGYLTTPLNDIALFILFALWVVNNWIWIFKYSWLNKEKNLRRIFTSYFKFNIQSILYFPIFVANLLPCCYCFQ